MQEKPLPEPAGIDIATSPDPGAPLRERPGWPARLRTLYHAHYDFWMLLVLFLGFRVLARILLRPGGYVVDSTDFEYYGWLGELATKGYLPNVNLVTAYPPLFPPLAVWLFEIAGRLPPWYDPRLVYHSLLGGVLLIFETGNFILIYDLARRMVGAETPPLEPDQAVMVLPDSSRRPSLRISPALIPPLIYAMLFAPVYTWMGWFESMPLFFLLLGTDLLLVSPLRPWGWLGSAVAAALGTLAKLTPLLLLPIGARWLGLRLSWRAARDEWFNPHSPGNLRRPLLYTLLFAVTLVSVGYALVRQNPALATSSLVQLSKRTPWESLWALLVGYHSYGKLPVDERDVEGLFRLVYHDELPWGLINAIFGAVYLWLYTRSYDWRRPRTLVAFTGISVLWLFLLSRGWSPQFQIWVLAFTVLLVPDMHGVLVALLLSVINYVEANLYLNLLPNQTWLLTAAVIIRTQLLLALALQFLAGIWPQARGAQEIRVAGRSLAVGMLVVALIGIPVTAPGLIEAYRERRLAEHPCQNAVRYLADMASQGPHAIATTQSEVWQWLYPWLRGDYQFTVLDYETPDGDPGGVAERRLTTLAQSSGGQFWWVEISDRTQPAGIADGYFRRPGVTRERVETIDACQVSRVTTTGP